MVAVVSGTGTHSNSLKSSVASASRSLRRFPSANRASQTESRRVLSHKSTRGHLSRDLRSGSWTFVARRISALNAVVSSRYVQTSILVKDALVIGWLSSFLDGLQQGVYISRSAQRRSVKKFQDRLRRSLCMAFNGNGVFRPIFYYDFDLRTLGKCQITLQLYHFSPRDSFVRHIRPSA